MVKGAILEMAMKIGVITTLAGALGACSGQQQQDDNLETSQQGGDSGDLGKDDAAEGNGQENIVKDGPSSGDTASGADINSVTQDDPELSGSLNGGVPPPAGNMSAPEGAAPPVNSALATPPPSSPGASPASASGGNQASVPGGRVRYVKEGGVQVMSAPGGSPVFTLEQGDHPVTWEENGWLKLTTGMYVPVDALSDRGIGRPASGNVWR